MKVSIIIPCYHTHSKYLKDLIQLYSIMNNVDEIIVVFSGYNDYDTLEIGKHLQISVETSLDMNKKVHFKYEEKRLYLGQAVAEAEKIATGDILVIQAADDYPTKNRIERILHYFDTYDIVALHHSFFTEEESQLDKIDTDEPTIINSQQLYDIYTKPDKSDCGFGFNFGFDIIASPCAYKKEAIGNWSDKPRGQDHATAKKILFKFNKSLITSEKLYHYIRSRSSIND